MDYCFMKDLLCINKALGGNTDVGIAQEAVIKRDYDCERKISFYDFLKFNIFLSNQKSVNEGVPYKEM